VRTTFLGAHALPPEFAGRADDYIALVCDEMLPAAADAKLADAVDAFCERIAFTPAQTARVFDAAKKHRLPVKLHADQLSDQGGTGPARRFRAVGHRAPRGARLCVRRESLRRASRARHGGRRRDIVHSVILTTRWKPGPNAIAVRAAIASALFASVGGRLIVL